MGNDEYKINILEVKGTANMHTKYNAICVVNANVNVEFEAPVDYVDEPENSTKNLAQKDTKEI